MKKLFLFLFLILFILTGCEQDAKEEFVLGCFEENCKLVYDGFEYLTYQPDKMSQTGKVSAEGNDFQYRLFNHDDYVTHGNSLTNGFKIMKRENEQLRTVYSHNNNNEGIYPFAYINGDYIFSVMDYSKDTQKFVGLFRLNEEHKLEQINTEMSEKSESIFGVGISAHDQIYTLLYENEKQNLYKTNLSLSEFELVAEDVNRPLSTLFDEVCYTKDQKLFCGQKMIKELTQDTATAWVLGNRYILEVDETAFYTVRDLDEQKLLFSGMDFIGFDIKSSEIIIYCDGDVKILEAD